MDKVVEFINFELQKRQMEKKTFSVLSYKPMDSGLLT